MILGLEAVDLLELTSTNHKLHLAKVRPHIWPSVQGDISLRLEPFVVSQAKTQLYQTLPNFTMEFFYSMLSYRINRSPRGCKSI